MIAWRVQRARATAAELHDRELPQPAERVVWLCEPSEPALVLGSAQPEAHVDLGAAARRGVAVTRRHSGGGAVLLVPGEVLWVDVVIPRHDPLWHDDVGVSFHWLGDAWADALAAVGQAGGVVHRGPMVRSPWSAMVCFAGLGSGEVTLVGAKAVGMSQRRTRAAARFQCAAYGRWDAPLLRALLADPAPTVGELEAMCTPVRAPLGDLADALVSALARR